MSDQPDMSHDRNKNKVSQLMSDMVKSEYESIQSSKEDHVMSGDCRTTIFKSGNLDLKQGNVKRAYSSSTLLLNSTSSIQSMPHCYPHLGVALDGNIEDKSGGYLPFQAVDLHELSLVEFIENSTKQLTWPCRLSLIRHLVSAIQHCHNLGRPLGNIVPEHISISCDGRNRPFIWDAGEPLSTKGDNMKCLGEIVYFILTDGNKYSGTINKQKISDCYRQVNMEQFAAIASTEPVETACDLVLCTMEESTTIDEIMTHPIFWSDSEKAAFISDLYDSMGGNSANFKDLESSLGVEICGADWTDKLELSSQEKTILEKGKHKVYKNLFVDKTRSNKIMVTDYVIDGNKLWPIKTEEADEKKWKRLTKLAQNSKENVGILETVSKEYEWVNDVSHCVMLESVLYKKTDSGPAFDGKSLYDLVRFLRNRKAHCSECHKLKKNNQELEYYEALNGYWNFYSARYPKLLIQLYRHRRQFPFYSGH